MQEINDSIARLTDTEKDQLQAEARILFKPESVKKARARSRRPQSERRKIPKGTFLRRVRA